MNFGPLNKIGGERRLNVAVSRARYEMKVFSTLLPEQIDERRTQAEGVLGLKQFMRYAQQGALKSVSSNTSEDSSLIVQQIAEALLRKGYDVKTNVGSSALRIDIAIIDPLHKDHYALGIVLDGANYYHLKTARDREIVQPTVLQMLGWRLMHVWTVDWLSHPENVIKVIMNNIEL